MNITGTNPDISALIEQAIADGVLPVEAREVVLHGMTPEAKERLIDGFREAQRLTEKSHMRTRPLDFRDKSSSFDIHVEDALETLRRQGEDPRALGQLKSRSAWVEAVAAAVEAGDTDRAQRIIVEQASHRTATFGAPVGGFRPFLGQNRKQRRAATKKGEKAP